MFRIFGRNQDRPLPSEYEDEIERVLTAVGHPDFVTMREGLGRVAEIGRSLTYTEPLGEYEAWMPYTSIFQQTAYESQYGDIVVELSRIESRVMFSE